MSIAAIASQLYTIQQKKNVPLRTAFSMMVREDLAMRFSIYNLTRIVTKSEFLASVAQTAFGERTPLQKKQDAAELKKAEQEKRFKQFTAVSIGNLNKKINLLASITERNTALINGIYGELGAFRMQRRMNINSFNARSVRIPTANKTIKGQIENINKQLETLQKASPGVKPRGARGITAKKTPKQKEKEVESNLFGQFLPFLIKNPKLLAMLGVGALRAVGLGTLAAQAYSVYNLPGALGRISTRAGGKTAYDSPITEQTSQFVDTGIATLGTYTATRAITGAASMIKNRGKGKLTPVSSREARAQIQGNMQRGFMKRGMTSQQAFGKASKRSAQFVKYSAQMRKFKLVDSALRGLGRRLPAVQLATVAFEVSRMSNYTADRASGTISQDQYRESMVNSYQNLIEYVGMPAMGTVLGGLAGTALFPGVGTSIGAFVGTLGGYLGSLLLDERSLAEKVYSMIHEDKVVKPQTEPPRDLPSEDDTTSGEIPVAGNFYKGAASETSAQLVAVSDQDFMSKVEQVSTKYNLKTEDLLAVMYAESRLDPSIVNPNGGATGLIQFMPKTAESLGTTTAALRMMSRSAQMDYVDKYFESVKLPKTGVDRGTLYSYIFLPGFARQGRAVLASATDPATAKYYNANKGLDVVEPFGVITTADLAAKTSKFATASFVRTLMPPVEAPATNVMAEKPPENPPATETAARSEESETTEIMARAGLNSAAAVNKKVEAGFKVMGDRILGIEKTSVVQTPSYTHNDNTLSLFSVNRP
jgi:hypothetical protein